MELYQVGNIIPKFAIHQDGCMLQWVNGVAMIYVLVDDPDDQLLQAIDFTTLDITFGVFTYNDVLTLALRIGFLDWIDAPYTPHTQMPEDLPSASYLSGTGMAATLLLVDSRDGQIKQMRYFSFSTAFSSHLSSSIQSLKSKPFDPDDYLLSIQQIRQRYTPKEIGQHMRQARFKLEKIK